MCESTRVLARPRAIGTAYGFIAAMENVGFTVVSIVSGVILDNSKGYFAVRLGNA